MGFKNYDFQKGEKVLLHNEKDLFAIARELKKLTDTKNYYAANSRKGALGSVLTVTHNRGGSDYIDCLFNSNTITVAYWEIEKLYKTLSIKSIYEKEIRER